MEKRFSKKTVKVLAIGIVLLMGIVLILSQSVSAQSLLDEIQKRGSLKLAIYLKSSSPLQRANDKTGEPEGYFPDVGRLLAKDLGVKAEFVDTEWSAIIPALVSSKVDMIISAPSATPQRALSIDFPAMVIYYDVAVLVHKEGTIKKVADLAKPGMKISVNQGTAQHFFAMQNYTNATIKPADGIMETRLDVASKRSDAALVDSYQAITFMKEYPRTDVLRDDSGKILIVEREPGSLAIRQGDPRFFNWLRAWTEWYRAQGILDAMYNKWMGPVFASMK
jgi:polar amino acid transport system substrate-binding protein